MSRYLKKVSTGAKALATDGMRGLRHIEGHANANALAYGVEEKEIMMPADPVSATTASASQDVKIFTKRRFGLMRSLFRGFEPNSNLENSKPIKHVGLMIVGDSYVDTRCYAPLARTMAEEGYHVALLTPPVKLHLNDADLCEEVLRYEPWQSSVEAWVVVGHGMGGVVASAFCSSTNAATVLGMVLLGSYPYEGVDLSTNVGEDDDTTPHKLTNLKSIAYVYGTEDGIATSDDVEKMKTLLPSSTTKIVKLEGGNHTNFCSSDGTTLQGKDNKATMSREEQQELTQNTILEVLKQVGPPATTNGDAAEQ